MPVIATLPPVTSSYNTSVRKAFVWGGALIFVISLASFVVVYGIVLAAPAPETDRAIHLDIAFDVALFTIFALHHSIMARTGAKAWITRAIPADLERSAYVWISSLLFLAVCWLWRPLPGVAWQLPGMLTWLGIALQLVGLTLTERGARIIGIWELAGVRQANRERPVEFKTTGPFALVRHPIYLGWILIVFGAGTMTMSRLLFATVSSVYLIAAVPLEESSLVESFGDKYRNYQRQVKWRVLPGLW